LKFGAWYRELIRHELIPKAVRYYTGEIIPEDDEDEESDEDEDDEDDEVSIRIEFTHGSPPYRRWTLNAKTRGCQPPGYRGEGPADVQHSGWCSAS
jgi:hypothetical protein